MRTPGQQPRILLTNVKQLDLLLTRQKDVELFDGAALDYLVFDEAHTFSGANGAETDCLIRCFSCLLPPMRGMPPPPRLHGRRAPVLGAPLTLPAGTPERPGRLALACFGQELRHKYAPK